ncbi:helix-turn-helix domain-containing protein [Herbidospora daliensis]|uniref:helix-turn-helix domain-containing protein n=1 Tax=Herbidospora daliensis TaxID=295585 RepID=UPI0007839BDB|nr:XRE family transcriptional regulator [Herbidospora daliensis]
MKDPEQWADVGERVREGRLAAALSQEELARALGLDRTMVAKIELGIRRIDALELIRLSDILGVPLDYLISTPPPVISRRAQLTEDTATDAGRQSFHLGVALSSWLADIRQLVEMELLAVPAIKRPPMTISNAASARRAARWVRETVDLGDRPIESLISICEQVGQLVAVVDVPGDGASAVDDDVAAAVVSRQGDPGRRRATAAHELGHLIIGDEYSADLGVGTSREEREAVVDAFAAELLIPSDVFRGLPSGDLRESLVRVSARYRTSWSLTVRQAVQAEFLTRDAAGVMKRRNPTKAELKEAIGWAPQPDLESIRVPPGYAHAVFEAYQKRLITTSRAVEMMRGHIDADDLPLQEECDSTP